MAGMEEQQGYELVTLNPQEAEGVECCHSATFKVGLPTMISPI